MPAASATHAGAPAVSSAAVAASWPLQAASCNGRPPSRSAGDGSAPLAKRCARSSAWPLAAAQCWGVPPSSSAAAAGAPRRSKASAATSCPAAAAACKGLPPASPAASARTLRLIRTSAKCTRSNTSVPLRTIFMGDGTASLVWEPKSTPAAGSAPSSNSVSITAACPCFAAQYKGRPGALPLAETSMLAPALTSCAMEVVCPLPTAQCRGLAPCLSTASRSQGAVVCACIRTSNVET
mmetsp:Transcript_47757/g.138015  ORF Transcript_47757/g.138015 Transcript_47757/m.138015 type:complete len:238 (-) Transcript_47757:1535-2248(-)